MGWRAPAALITVAVLASLSSCGSDDSPPTLAISVSDPSQDKVVLTAPESVEAGLVEIELENRGDTWHEAQLFKYEGRHTPDELVSQLVNSLGSMPKPDWALPMGGVARVSPGKTGTVVQVLPPGRYFIADLQERPAGWPTSNVNKGGITSLEVTGEADGTLPDAPGRITARDDRFDVSGIEPGVNRVRFTNASKQPHHVVAVPVREGVPFAKAKANLIRRKGDLGWPPTYYPGSRATAVLDSGAKQTTELDLKPGRYALVCFLSDREGGYTHLARGLATELNVR
jgi:hypothetical protein